MSSITNKKVKKQNVPKRVRDFKMALSMAGIEVNFYTCEIILEVKLALEREKKNLKLETIKQLKQNTLEKYKSN